MSYLPPIYVYVSASIGQKPLTIKNDKDAKSNSKRNGE